MGTKTSPVKLHLVLETRSENGPRGLTLWTFQKWAEAFVGRGGACLGALAYLIAGAPAGRQVGVQQSQPPKEIEQRHQ